VETVHCKTHGVQPQTLVCQHITDGLLARQRVGFFWTTDTPDNLRPDAWCAACEAGYVQQVANGPEKRWNTSLQRFSAVSATTSRNDSIWAMICGPKIKTSHCVFQNRPLVSETGQYRRWRDRQLRRS
jgi:hypothetical protein